MRVGRVLALSLLGFLTLYVGSFARADSVTNCINRCGELCGYFPNNPECQRQAVRCVFRCKGAKNPY
jgi:hypothetical protein